MRLKFDTLISYKDTIKIDFNDGRGWQTYSIQDIVNNGGYVEFDASTVSDLSKIKVRGAVQTIEQLDVEYVPDDVQTVQPSSDLVTNDAVINYVTSVLDDNNTAKVSQSGAYIDSVEVTKSVLSATTKPFDNEISNISDNTNAPSSLAVKSYVDTNITSANSYTDNAIDELDVSLTAYINDAITTNSANFIGTFNSLEELNAYSGEITNNDTAIVLSADGKAYNKYKYSTAVNDGSWVFEYTLNTSSFTSTELAAIQSGITASLVNKITTMTGASTESNGQEGLVPAPQKDDKLKYLRGDGSWATPYTNATTTSDGLMSAADKTKLNGLTTYSNATTSAAGLMSAEDKTKLNGLTSYSNATTSAAGLMSAADKTKLNGLTTYSNATTSAAGLMSVDDKTKLDGLTTYSAATTSTAGLMSAADKTKLNGLTTYSNATTSTAGLMSSTDKSKLDSMTDITTISSSVPKTPSASYDSRYYINTANITLTLAACSTKGRLVTVISNVAASVSYPDINGTSVTKSMAAGSVFCLYACGSGYTTSIYGLTFEVNPSNTSGYTPGQAWVSI